MCVCVCVGTQILEHSALAVTYTVYIYVNMVDIGAFEACHPGLVAHASYKHVSVKKAHDLFLLPLFHHLPLPPLLSGLSFLSPVNDLVPLDVQNDAAVTQILLNSPQDSLFPLCIALNLFQSIVTSIPQ